MTDSIFYIKLVLISPKPLTPTSSCSPSDTAHGFFSAADELHEYRSGWWQCFYAPAFLERLAGLRRYLINQSQSYAALHEERF